jgi:predicted lipoprotein with Yx(FWY)xxD motif
VSNNSKLGQILTDPQGRTLYWWTKDTSGTSNCTGNCATTWPPFSTSNPSPTLPTGVLGTLAVITRPEGTKQVTYDGMPLYYYSKDAAPGDTNGQGVGKVWWEAIKPASAVLIASRGDTHNSSLFHRWSVPIMGAAVLAIGGPDPSAHLSARGTPHALCSSQDAKRPARSGSQRSGAFKPVRGRRSAGDGRDGERRRRA